MQKRIKCELILLLSYCLQYINLEKCALNGKGYQLNDTFTLTTAECAQNPDGCCRLFIVTDAGLRLQSKFIALAACKQFTLWKIHKVN